MTVAQQPINLAMHVDEENMPTQSLLNGWQDYPIADGGLKKLKEMISASASYRPPGMLIWGPTNNGKTTLARKFQYMMNMQAKTSREFDEIPVVYVQAPPGPDVRHVCADIINAVGKTIPQSSTKERRIRQVTVLLGNVGARMLIIDEIHNVFEGKVNHTTEFLNFLKYLSNELLIPIVTIGVESARFGMQTDQQIGNRFVPFHMPAWEPDEDYAAFAGKVFNAYGIHARAMVTKPRPMSMLHNRTGGLTGETWSFADYIAKTRHGLDGNTLTLDSLDPPGWTSPDMRRK